MNTRPPRSGSPGGCGDVGDMTPQTPRWWVVLWSVWGFLVGGIVGVLDGDPWLALPWAVGGLLLGRFGLKVLRPLASPYWNWYRSRFSDTELRHDFLVMTPEGAADDEKVKRWLEEASYSRNMAGAPLGGLFHGVLAGPIVGALAGIDGKVDVSAAMGAAIGIFLWPLFLAFLTGATFACLLRLRPELPLRVRLARRGLLVVAPLVFVLALWHCLVRTRRQRQAAR
jgi:hypothetical protein